MDNNEIKTPKSQLNWQKKYDAEKMQTIGIKCPIDEKAYYKAIADKNSMPLALFMRRCAMYCIDNNIDITAYTPKGTQGE